MFKKSISLQIKYIINAEYKQLSSQKNQYDSNMNTCSKFCTFTICNIDTCTS